MRLRGQSMVAATHASPRGRSLSLRNSHGTKPLRYREARRTQIRAVCSSHNWQQREPRGLAERPMAGKREDKQGLGAAQTR